MADSIPRDPAALLKLLGDSFIPIPWAHAEAEPATRAPLKDGGNYPSAPPGYSESMGSGATYSAFRLGVTLFITAEGTLANLNQFADIRQAPIRIYPPAFDFLVYSPPMVLPATRPFKFTVMVGFPTAPKTVQIRDARGSHYVEIGSVSLPDSKASLANTVDAVGEGFGLGRSIDEAISAAIESMPAKPSPIADVMHLYKVIESGKMMGGFAGLDHYYARVGLTSS